MNKLDAKKQTRETNKQRQEKNRQEQGTTPEAQKGVERPNYEPILQPLAGTQGVRGDFILCRPPNPTPCYYVPLLPNLLANLCGFFWDI